MKMPWDDRTQEWIDCVKPFFPNDLYLAKKALKEKINSDIPEWILSLITLMLFDGVAIEERVTKPSPSKSSKDNEMWDKFVPHKGSEHSIIACEFLNDKATITYKYPDDFKRGGLENRWFN